ncbi:DNA methyltransferase [Sorangium sp. So ce1000]|uniref:DNA methyltransferase n=1 Tax=Sorangium sp. So ce1000 TaxID=3133325 RepID=UPI003F5EB59C
MEGSLTPEQTAACLDTLGADRLRALLDTLDLEATDRRSRSALIAAISRAPLPDVVRALRVPELRAFCMTLGVHDKGTKDVLVKRVLAAPGTRVVRSHGEGRDGAAGAGALKSALRRFTLEAAAGFGVRDAQTKFVKAFFGCFGWRDGEPPGADIPASLSVVEHGQRATRNIAAVWSERRVLVDVVAPDIALDAAWNELLRACLEQSPGPQFVVLTNQRELRLYDLARDRSVPRLATPIDDLPKYSDAFVFLGEGWVPGTTPKIVNVGKVSREVADLVAKLYRSLKSKFPKREAEVIRFTLQCIITMFAEDIGLLPPDYFTTLLYEGARHRDVERRLRELFALMGTRDVKPPRPVAYFNGGLFAAPVTLPLGDAELTALTRAAEAHWKYVDPHIFGSVFQGIMDDAERHASGAHYTAHEDIMRVVGPTIVEPWRKRIAEAKTLTELLDVRRALAKFRVLDPACGSGNFLYVAFRELYSLETQLLARIREFSSGQSIGWGSVISTLNFYGIDTNAFAVELAKVTLNIAKKIAYEDRRQKAAVASFQGEIEVDPSLPLDNLDKNIVCADALFTEWPEVDAIVGNPPILGDRKIRGELGREYLERLQETSGVDGVVDLSCHWFRRAHDRLPAGGRAGLVGTSGIRVGKARAATLDYIAANGGTITNAVSSVLWPGDAALNVSMVNWTKADMPGPHALEVDGQTYHLARIPTHLQLHTDVSEARDIRANRAGTGMGVIFGHEAFRSSGNEGFSVAAVGMKDFVRPVATGDDMLRGKLSIGPDYCIHLGAFDTESRAKAAGGKAFEHLKSHVYPMVKERAESEVETHHYARWLRTWWHPREPSLGFFTPLMSKRRFIACSNPQARPVFAFLSSRFVPTNTMQVFAFDDDYSFGIIQSHAHWAWVIAKGGKVTERKRYTSEVWTTFPWPQEVSEKVVVSVASAARELRATRERLMKANSWSLRELHQAAEVDGPHPLKDAQRALDEAVSEAYGMPSDQELTEFLLDLNRCLVEDEEQGRTVTGPGLPPGLDPKDRRWLSADCIEPPSISE